MPIYLRQSTASQEIPLGRFVNSTDGDTEETGLTIANTDIKLWKTGATTLADKNSGGATHIANGLYYCVLDATDTATIGPMEVHCHVAGALAVKQACCVLDEAVYDVMFGTTAPSTLAAGALMGLANDAITAAKFDESTAFPLKSADSGATAVARTGADSDTLETLSDELVAMKGATFDTGTDSLEAIRDRGDAAWVTASGFSTHSAADVVTALGTGSGLTALATASALATVAGYIDTEIALILKWIGNKLVTTDNENGTLTTVLYDDDGSTPLKTWVFTTATGTRAAAS